MRNIVVAAALGVCASFLGVVMAGQAERIAQHRYNLLGESIGLSGYDPVSYFPEGGGKPEKGLIGIAATHDGVTYRFSTKEHLALFAKDPEKFVPAYGGWCAYAVAALDKRVDADPTSYDIRDGRLFVFYRDPALDTRILWLKTPDSLLAKAEANWPGLAR